MVMIRVGITDDHQLVISGVRALLEGLDNIVVVGSWNSLESTRIGLKNLSCDVLLLDLNLPDGDGIDLCEELSTLYPAMHILALSSYDLTPYVKRMIKNGASGYLLKNVSGIELRSAIETVNAGEQYIQQSLKEKLLNEQLGNPNTKNTFEIRITYREKEILKLIAESKTTAEIASKLFISVKTVETHRSHLMDKLGVKNAVGLVKVALDKGLI